MILILVTLIICLVWLILYKKNEKIVLSLPYLLIVFISPIYIVLDILVFVNIFGCGCVPTDQTNMFNIPFNANNLRQVVYSVLTIICTIMGIKLSKRINNKFLKVIYILLILAFNIAFSLLINYLYAWL